MDYEENDVNPMWHKIQEILSNDNRAFWESLLNQDKTQFRLKFRESFLEYCKNWLSNLNTFIENDETWAAIMETQSKILDDVGDDDDEALFAAVDARKYKVYKNIDWKRVENDILGIDDDDEEDADEDEDDDEQSGMEDNIQSRDESEPEDDDEEQSSSLSHKFPLLD